MVKRVKKVLGYKRYWGIKGIGVRRYWGKKVLG